VAKKNVWETKKKVEMTLHDQIIDTLHELSDSSVYTLARIMHAHNFKLLQRTCSQMTEEGILQCISPTVEVRDTRYRLTEYGMTLFIPPVSKKRGIASRTIKAEIRHKQQKLSTMEDAILAVLQACAGMMATLFEVEAELQKVEAVDQCLFSSTIYKLLYAEKVYKIGSVIGLY
jgi:hypothetical protein